jgi:hypothetical protein
MITISNEIHKLFQIANRNWPKENIILGTFVGVSASL